MLHGKSVGVVVPAYNEETQIGMVIETMPEFVDRIVIVNDTSTDRTRAVVEGYFNGPCDPLRPLPAPPDKSGGDRIHDAVLRQLAAARREEEKFYPEVEIVSGGPDRRIVLLNHKTNQGKGGGIISGYKWCRDHAIDCTGSMDGDGQMDPAELESLCLPVVSGRSDYVKGNRLIHQGARIAIPKLRFFGNSVLSILTKLASGYWHVSDTQTGYATISLAALEAIDIYDIYRYYGYPNDMLVKLNIAYCTVSEVRIKPVYHIGEQSKMKIRKVVRKVSWLLLKLFFYRLWKKYLFRDFHPLFLLYHLSFLLLLCAIPYAGKIIYYAVSGRTVGTLPVLAFLFLSVTGLQAMFFAMWMDMQDNERLYQ